MKTTTTTKPSMKMTKKQMLTLILELKAKVDKLEGNVSITLPDTIPDVAEAHAKSLGTPADPDTGIVQRVIKKVNGRIVDEAAEIVLGINQCNVNSYGEDKIVSMDKDLSKAVVCHVEDSRSMERTLYPSQEVSTRLREAYSLSSTRSHEEPMKVKVGPCVYVTVKFSKLVKVG